MKYRWMLFSAPILYPVIGFAACFVTLLIATDMHDIVGNASLTLHFGVGGLIQFTVIAGVLVALATRFVRKLRNFVIVVFFCLGICAAVLGWIFAQSIIHF